MSLRNWDSEIAKKEMTRLTQPNVLGFYTHFEATVVFAFPPGQQEPINVFSFIVAEERLPTASEEPHYLNPERIVLRSLRDWTFGIKRYVKPIADLMPAFDVLCESKTWGASGHPLQTAELVPIPTQFVRSDDFGLVPLNRVLKNNFWNGSHVFEWADANKAALHPLFDDPPRLQELSEAVRAFVPIGLASLSDRLGNVVLQLPITVLIAKFAELRASGDFTLSTAWHPRATARPLRASCAMEYDKAIPAFNSVIVQGAETLLPMHDGQGLHRGVLWDDENRILLAATGDMAFINERFARSKPSPSASARFAAEQRATLTGIKSNLRGLNLAYRMRAGAAGWGFHDRFLIFPGTDSAALAWSLGTSINSLGRQHHILQRVDDGQRIKDAFAELWDALDQPEHLIWKTP
jgi:hypothetical protein